MDWIQQWQSKLNKQNGVAPLVRTGGSRHTGLAALPYRNIQSAIMKPPCVVNFYLLSTEWSKNLFPIIIMDYSKRQILRLG